MILIERINKCQYKCNNGSILLCWRVRKKGQNKMKSSPQMEKETAIDRRAHTRTFPGWTHTYTHDKDLKRRFTQQGKKDQFTLISLPGNTQHSTAQLGMQQTRAVAEVKRWACFFSPLQLYSVCICTVNCEPEYMQRHGRPRKLYLWPTQACMHEASIRGGPAKLDCHVRLTAALNQRVWQAQKSNR